MLQLLPESVSDEPTTVTAWERDAIKRRPDILFTQSSLPNMGTEISHSSRVLLLKHSTQFQPKSQESHTSPSLVPRPHPLTRSGEPSQIS